MATKGGLKHQNSTFFYRKKLFRLDPRISDEVQISIEIEPEIELFLGVGIVRNDEYIGLYINLTAWNLSINGTYNLDNGLHNQTDETPPKLLRLTLSMRKPNMESKAGTHLIIIDDSPCGNIGERSSDPKFLNYYRQFLIKSETDSLFNHDEADLKHEITGAISRVFSGVSAILAFEIINFRPIECPKHSCRVVEFYLTVDTSKKMQNGVNIDVSVDRLVFYFNPKSKELDIFNF